VHHGGKFAILPAFEFRECIHVHDKLLICVHQERWIHLVAQVITFGFLAWSEVDSGVFAYEFAFNPFTAFGISPST
jgi:hypothetical protein